MICRLLHTDAALFFFFACSASVSWASDAGWPGKPQANCASLPSATASTASAHNACLLELWHARCTTAFCRCSCVMKTEMIDVVGAGEARQSAFWPGHPAAPDRSPKGRADGPVPAHLAAHAPQDRQQPGDAACSYHSDQARSVTAPAGEINNIMAMLLGRQRKE